MLYLIGLGITDERALTLEALEISKKCECFIETYTSKWKGSVKKLQLLIGKDIRKLQRQDLEEKLEYILELAKQKDIAIFFIGDPLAATTHIDLVIEAKKKKIPVKISHNASIFSAIAETGLQLYKFGRTATVPFTRKLENIKETIEGNKKLGLHTLLLLDIEMSVKEGLEILEDLIKGKVIAANIPGVVYYDTPENLKDKEIPIPAVIIVPGKLHFREKEFLEIL